MLRDSRLQRAEQLDDEQEDRDKRDDCAQLHQRGVPELGAGQRCHLPWPAYGEDTARVSTPCVACVMICKAAGSDTGAGTPRGLGLAQYAGRVKASHRFPVERRGVQCIDRGLIGPQTQHRAHLTGAPRKNAARHPGNAANIGREYRAAKALYSAASAGSIRVVHSLAIIGRARGTARSARAARLRCGARFAGPSRGGHPRSMPGSEQAP
jgi:hypothetical protein